MGLTVFTQHGQSKPPLLFLDVPNPTNQVVALATGWITQEHPGLVVARRRKLLKVTESGPRGNLVEI